MQQTDPETTQPPALFLRVGVWALEVTGSDKPV